MHSIKVGEETIPVRPNAEHVYLLETALVAKGYGVDPRVIRDHKRLNAAELVEGKHWIACDEKFVAGKPPAKRTYWTKRGVVRLGFFIKSERAKLFRDAAEDLVIAASTPRPLPLSYPEALRAIAALTEKGTAAAEAAALILPRAAFASISRITGQPRTRLIPAYFRTGRLDGATKAFLVAEQQLDLPYFLEGGAS